MELSVRCSFPADVAVTPAARLVAAELLRSTSMDEVRIDEVLLVVSELVTNAVLHAATAVDLVVGIADDDVRIEVTDGSPAPPSRRPPAADVVGGHGLNLVDGATTQWGVSARPDGRPGKVVWAVMART